MQAQLSAKARGCLPGSPLTTCHSSALLQSVRRAGSDERVGEGLRLASVPGHFLLPLNRGPAAAAGEGGAELQHVAGPSELALGGII